MLDRIHAFWFSDFRGSPVWGWFVILIVAAAIVSGIVIAAFGGELGHRCNSYGDCFPEF